MPMAKDTRAAVLSPGQPAIARGASRRAPLRATSAPAAAAGGRHTGGTRAAAGDPLAGRSPEFLALAALREAGLDFALALRSQSEGRPRLAGSRNSRIGKSTVNTLPFPSSLAAWIGRREPRRSPWRYTAPSLSRDGPFRRSATRARTPCRARCSAIPRPASSTANLACRSSIASRNVTLPPGSVNFKALWIKLDIAWWMRRPSQRSLAVASETTWSVTCFCRASPEKSSASWRSSSAASTSVDVIFKREAQCWRHPPGRRSSSACGRRRAE